MTTTHTNSERTDLQLNALGAITVSYANNIKTTATQKVGLDIIVNEIKSDVSLEANIARIRAAKNSDEKALLKKTLLPYFSFSSFKNDKRSNDNFQSTQFLIFDADYVADLTGLRSKVTRDPDAFMAFTSPGGEGLKIVYRLAEPITHGAHYTEVYTAKKTEFENRYGVKLDDSTKDPARATFLSHDPDIYINPDSALITISSQSPSSKPGTLLDRRKSTMTTAIQPAEEGDRTEHIASMIGVMIKTGVKEDAALEFIRGWNNTNPSPHTDDKIVSQVTDMYRRYNRKNLQPSTTFVERNNSYFKQTYTTHGVQETQLTNFIIKPTELLVFKNGDCLTCSIETENGAIYDGILLENSDWHGKVKLLKAIGRSDCNFLGTDIDIQPLCKFVIDQVTVRKTGVTVMGLHGDTWVIKDGNIIKSGWASQQAILPFGKGSDAFFNKIEYQRLEDAEYQAMLTQLYECLPAMNNANVVLPWLGWMMAAPMKEKLQQMIGGFPLAFVHGGQGSGKTSTGKLFMRLSGYKDPTPFSCTMKTFPMLKLLTSTNGIPVLLDELKKSDMKEDIYDQLLRFMRKLYIGEVESKGNADQTTTDYELKAPVTVMGEWRINQPAIAERIIMVSFANAAKKDMAMQEAFKILWGLPLEGFMPRYLQFCLGADVKERYACAEKLVKKVFGSQIIAPRVRNNMSVMVIGLGLYKTFGRKHGIKVGKIDFDALLKRQLKDITGNETGSVQSAVDQLIEGFGSMARRGKILNGKDYRIDGGNLYIQFNKNYPVFKQDAFLTKYEGDQLDQRSYLQLFDETEYVIDKNKNIRIDGKQARCLVIDIQKASSAGVDLEGFEAEVPVKGGGSADLTVLDR